MFRIRYSSPFMPRDVKLRELEKHERTFRICGNPEFVEVCLRENRGYREYEVFRISELPNEVISAEELESRGIVPAK